MSSQAKSPLEISAILILSHHMDEHGLLGDETLTRMEKALELFVTRNAHYLITSGWNYLPDCPHNIGEVIAERIVSQYPSYSRHILINTESRDTVGDAFFIREAIVKPKAITQLTVVTSDYHVKRSSIIFDSFYQSGASVSVVGADTELTEKKETMQHEEASISAFRNTFSTTDLSDSDSVWETLSNDHPFYNGQIHPRLVRAG